MPAITFQVTGDPEETRVYKRAGRQLQERDRADGEHRRGARARRAPGQAHDRFSAGKAPEVFLLNYRYLGGFAAKGVIEPAGPRLDASEAFEREDFYPIPLQAFEYDGALQCVPQNASASLVLRTTLDAFKEAGIEPPKDSWTYDEFTAAAEQAHDRQAPRRRPRPEHDPRRPVGVGRGR